MLDVTQWSAAGFSAAPGALSGFTLMAQISDADLLHPVRDDATTPRRSRARPAEEIAAMLVPNLLAKTAAVHDEFGELANMSSIRT